MHLLELAGCCPAPEGAIHIRPRWKFARQHAPGTAGAHHVPTRIPQVPAAVLGRPPALARLLEQVRHQLPLGLRQTTRIALILLLTAMFVRVAIASLGRFLFLRPPLDHHRSVLSLHPGLPQRFAHRSSIYRQLGPLRERSGHLIQRGVGLLGHDLAQTSRPASSILGGRPCFFAIILPITWCSVIRSIIDHQIYYVNTLSGAALPARAA